MAEDKQAMTTDKAKRYGIVKGYHQQTKHHLNGYARSLGYMDWANQPKPFRVYYGAPQLQLPLLDHDRGYPYSALFQPTEDSPQPISISSIASMLELSMGLSAWKKFGSSEWALRMNPSSGNLHPTECYLLLPDIEQQSAGISHYLPYGHAIEQRTVLNESHALWLNNCGGFGIILTSIPWREAWKYGERAFRYCHHDLGHALAALRYACNLNGWQMILIPDVSEQNLDRFLGFDQCKNYEGEYANCLCWVGGKGDNPNEIVQWFSRLPDFTYQHQPNRLSDSHVDWELITKIQQAIQTGHSDFFALASQINPKNVQGRSAFTAEEIIRKRRSAQDYDLAASQMDLTAFLHSLRQTLPESGCPCDVFPYQAQVHLAIFVHAVVGLESGLYILVRNAEHLALLKEHSCASFDWYQVKGELPLYLLQKGDFRATAQKICCTQAIASDGAFSLGMIAHFDAVLVDAPAMYPRLFWETGLIGQVLYLAAEADDLQATGIGCFFDDEMHHLLGFKDEQWQSLYHFTVGKAVRDDRIETKAPYFHLTT